MLPALQLDCDRECARIVEFIRQVLADAGYSRVVVGLSGGVVHQAGTPDQAAYRRLYAY